MDRRARGSKWLASASALCRFVLLFASMYAAFGVASPFLPAFVNSRGVGPAQLGLVLAAGTAVQLLSTPLAGRIGDLTRNLRRVLIASLALSAVATLGYLPARGLWSFLAINLLRSLALAPVTVLADALALGSSSASRADGGRGYQYAWVRGAGSAAFIGATLVSGQVVSAYGLSTIIVSQSLLLGAAAASACAVPELAHAQIVAAAVRAPVGGVLMLLRMPLFRTLILAAALILGSHAMHDGFAVIRWRAAGISPATVSVLWSESVAAEVVVFIFVGPALLRWLGPPGAVALAAVAGTLRWIVMAQTTQLLPLSLIQPLHGITFALFHLACMQLIACIVPAGLEGTAQSIYATGIGAASTLLTLASGWLYASLGPRGFWVMASLCGLGLIAAWRLSVAAQAQRRS